MKLFIFFLLFLPFNFLFAQTQTGQVTDEAGRPLSGILVVNLQSEARTTTGSEGYFTISAGPNDEIRIVSPHFERQSFLFKNLPSVIRLQRPIREIEEVAVHPKPSGDLSKDRGPTPADILARQQIQQGLGIRQATGQERKAEPRVENRYIGALLGILTLQPFLVYNHLSGEYIRQARTYRYQDLQHLKSEIIRYNGQAFFVQLGIPENRIGEFLDFALATEPDLNYRFKKQKQLAANVPSLYRARTAYLKKLEDSGGSTG